MSKYPVTGLNSFLKDIFYKTCLLAVLIWSKNVTLFCLILQSIIVINKHTFLRVTSMCMHLYASALYACVLHTILNLFSYLLERRNSVTQYYVFGLCHKVNFLIILSALKKYSKTPIKTKNIYL